MQSLEKRIAALERVQPSVEEMTIIRRIVSPRNLHPAFNHIRSDDGEIWTRQPGESEQDFTDRATREVKRNQWGSAGLIADEAPNLEVRHAKH